MTYADNLTAEQRAILYTPDKQTLAFMAWCRAYRIRTGASMNAAVQAYQLEQNRKLKGE